MAVTKRLRFEILRRDNHACRYCGATAPEVKLTVDHVKPVALGGADAPSNLVAACAGCNSGKSSTSPDAPLVADIEADALRWAAAMRKAAEIHSQAMLERDHYINKFYWAWSDWRFGPDELIATVPADYEQSIITFYNYGLPFEDVERAVRTAMNKSGVVREKKWRYFCGICWRTLDEFQQITTGILATEEPGTR